MYKDKVILLRQRIPIGLKEGLNILEKTNGDIDKAEVLFQQGLVNQLIKSNNVSEETAKAHLERHNFDINKAIESINAEKYTLTELILKRYGADKEEALSKIWLAIEEKENLVSDFWLTIDSINKLNSCQYCLITILVWLDYEEYEGFDYAVSFRLDTTLKEIKIQLLLTEFSDNLQKAYNRKNEIELKYQGKLDFVAIGNKLRKDKLFKAYELYFKQHRKVLIDSLYEYVVKNIHFYP